MQEPIEIFEGPNFCNDAVVVKQNGINFRRVADQCRHTVYHESVTLGGCTEHFTTNDGFKVMAYAKYSV